MTEMIRQELGLFWRKLVFFFGQFQEFVRQIIDDPASVTRWDRAVMAAILLIVVLFVIGGVIRFLTEPWKKKGEILLVTLLVILVLAIIAFFVLRNIPLP